MNSAPAGSIEVNGAALRHVRRLTGLTITALAGEIDVTPTYLSMLETGSRKRCSPQVFAALCIALRLDDRRVLMGLAADHAGAA